MSLIDRFVPWACVSILVFCSACGESDKAGGTTKVSYENNGPGSCSGSTRPKNDDFCNGKCTQETTCGTSGRPIDSCCVLVGEPGSNPASPYLKRTTNTKEFADPSGAPANLDCFEPSGYPTAGSGGTAKLTGEVRPFANGGCSEADLVGVTLEIFKVNRTGDPATDGALGQQIGATLTVSDTMPIVQESVNNNCVEKIRYNRVYEVADVPMDTELVLKTTGPGWTPLYAYNIYITAKDADYNATAGTYTYNARALAEDDFSTIPTVAIGATIQPGNGAIGGEVHDCGNIRLQNAKVDISQPRAALEYFNASEDNPLPDQGQRVLGTGPTALYTALDIKVSGAEGSFARVAGTGLIQDGEQSKLVSLGYFDVRVFPDSVTSVSLRGLRPFQVK